MLAKFLVSPEYDAVTKFSPGRWLTLDVVRVAMPLLSVPVPSDVDPLKNSTVPVGSLPLTSAVNVTCDPTNGLLGIKYTAVVVFALDVAPFTVCESAADVLALLLVSPG